MNKAIGHLMPAYMKTGGTCVVATDVLRWKARNCVSKSLTFNMRATRIGLKVKLHFEQS